ncbi:DUF222 domain-containing protein [Allokutzneria albata]|uniref:DUF222 domain-containing protein n=1 Tax=Allokutzneria albata TaxID=211114 RepID=UPI0004C3DB33|nr:DUF222 domain-containing protein [Allokutzneria albata]
MLDVKEIMDVLVGHLAANDTYQLSEDEHLAFLQDLETITNLVTAAKIDAATHAEERGLHARYDALVISDAIKRLPGEHVEQADQALAEVAPTLPPRDLMRVGKHLRSLVDPDEVYRDEQEGIAKPALRMGNDQDGCLHIKAIIDPLNGEKFRTFLPALSKPKTVNGEKDPRTSEQRLADAFIEAMTTAMSAKDLPINGGMRTQLIVTMGFDALAAKTGCGQPQNGDPISAGLMRQAACDAGVIPIVLGGDSEPLDYGRERRLASPAQRRALALRDKGCAGPAA